MPDSVMYLNPRTMKKTAGVPAPAAVPTVDAPVKQPLNPVYNGRQEKVVENLAPEILVTTDFDMFRLIDSNRPLDMDDVHLLADDIRRRNHLHLHPIKVTSAGEIVDGQHRWAAAQLLEVPLYYQVCEDISIEDAVNWNSRTRNWSAADYLHHWSVKGKPDYIKLRNLVTAHPWMTIPVAYQMAFVGDLSRKGAAGETLVERFRRGRYVANNIEMARKIAEQIDDLSPHMQFKPDSLFATAFLVMASHRQYQHDRFRRKMQYLSTKLVKCTDTDSYIDLFNYIYNYQQRSGEHVMFRKITIRDPEHRMHHLSKEGKAKVR